MVNEGNPRPAAGAPSQPASTSQAGSSRRSGKALLSAALATVLRAFASADEGARRLWSHASLAAQLKTELPASAVVLGRTSVYGTRCIHFGEDVLLYPDLHLETQGSAEILVGDGVVLSRGVHLVAMAGVTLGAGTMVGEYTSIRDANHLRAEGAALRDAGHAARPIHIGQQVWIGRGAAILAGVTIGDQATIAANAVVTRDVPAGSVVGGVPARALTRRTSPPLS